MNTHRDVAASLLLFAAFVFVVTWGAFSQTPQAEAQPTQIVYEGAQTAKFNTASALTVTKVSTLGVGDLMVVGVLTNTPAGNVATPSGWTLVRRSTSGSIAMYTFYKVATSADTSATSFTFTSSVATQAVVTLLVFNGVDTANPVVAESGWAGTVSTTITATGVTTAKPKAMLVGTYGLGVSRSNNFSGYTSPLTEANENNTTGGGAILSMAMAYGEFTGSGATGNKSVATTRSGTAAAHLLAIRLPNQAPVVSVDPPQAANFMCPTYDQSPTDHSVTFTGAASDSDGSIASVGWTKLSGPAGGNDTMSGETTNTLTVTWPTYPPTAPVVGTYTYQFSATDDEGLTRTAVATVVIPANQAPVFNNIATPVNVTSRGIQGMTTVTLGLGGAVVDPNTGCPQPTVAWTKIGVTPSGATGGNTITSPTSVQTTVTDIVTTSGRTYTYRLTATDYMGLTAQTDVDVVVPDNFPPTVSNCSATPATLALPDQNRTTISCTVTDDDSMVWDVKWTKGKLATGNPPNPPGDTIVYDIGPTTDVTYNIAQGAGGTYNYFLTATDDFGAIGTGTVQVVVNVSGNALPVVNAGTDQYINLPGTTSVSLNGSATDANGPLPLTYTWTKVSGPAGGTIQNPNAASTYVTGLANEGTYVFRLTVKDGWGGTGTDDVAVIASVPAFSTQAPVSGYMWSNTIGWLSMSCTDSGSCGSANYGVTVNTNTGALSGFAWAANIGYINFAPSGTAPDGTNCSSVPCAVLDIAALQKEKKVTGWARACSVLTTGLTNCTGSALNPDFRRGGWDGWIKLYANPITQWTNPPTRTYLPVSDPLYGTTYDPLGWHGVYYDDLIGFAWGGAVVGWIDFFGAHVIIPVPILNVVELQRDFGDVWVGTSVDRDFTVENVGDLGSFLRGTGSVTLGMGEFSCVNNCDYTVNGIAVGFPRLVTIRFTATPFMAPGIHSGQVTFTGLNAVPASSMVRDVLANVIVPVFGNDLAFGNVVVGRWRELVLTFENEGAINLCTGVAGDPTPCLDTLVLPFPEYTCQPSCTANLAPGVQNNIIIRFTPTAVQQYNGDAFLQNHPTVTFGITGAGVLGTFQFRDQ